MNESSIWQSHVAFFKTLNSVRKKFTSIFIFVVGFPICVFRWVTACLIFILGFDGIIFIAIVDLYPLFNQIITFKLCFRPMIIFFIHGG